MQRIKQYIVLTLAIIAVLQAIFGITAITSPLPKIIISFIIGWNLESIRLWLIKPDDDKTRKTD